ncbi:hypothetical protein [Pelosinus baikalensis]|uniref:Uncharacterized protein n=1 Tax=Pelosinus baikalensis TaxID=2892015 RepID=A0ABS8HZ66_9FIRM|nr:hypothetical protein [Pelosinus baikalensis]MCC5468451.1 hypothetical protein [Pelosinus baikalensis]
MYTKIYVCYCGASILVSNDPSELQNKLIEEFNQIHSAPGHQMMWRCDVNPIPAGLDITRNEFIFISDEEDNNTVINCFIDKNPSYNGWIIIIRKDKSGREHSYRFECINGQYKRSKFWREAERIQIPRR